MADREEPKVEGAPEWMVSFADMVTILMAFFVVMYAMSGPKDVQKEEAVFSSLRRSLGRWPVLPQGTWVPRSSKLAAFATVGRGDETGTTHDPASPESTRAGSPRVDVDSPGNQRSLGAAVY